MIPSGFDVMVVGLGTVGAATCMELARRGVSVIGLDAFRPPHRFGSHHGDSRSIRRAYMEGTGYVPLAIRAWELWRRLEKDSGKNLLVTTGNLTLGPRDGKAVTGFLASARAHDIAFEDLTAAEIRRRWPQLVPHNGFAGGLEKEAGVIFPETAIDLFLSEAEKAGATLRFNERVDRWRETGDRVTIHTTQAEYEGGCLLLTAGARNKRLLKTSGSYLSPKRVPVLWVAPPQLQDYCLGNLPVNFWQLPLSGDAGDPDCLELYALPVTRPGGRVKVAAHSHLSDCDPDTMTREIRHGEMAAIRLFLKEFIPALAGCDITADVCLYSMTPDRDFALGQLPGHRNVFTAALAGHGFKFAPVLGELLADIALGNSPAFDLSMFAISRFTNTKIP
jgi:sarcosine oxidase